MVDETSGKGSFATGVLKVIRGSVFMYPSTYSISHTNTRDEERRLQLSRERKKRILRRRVRHLAHRFVKVAGIVTGCLLLCLAGLQFWSYLSSRKTPDSDAASSSKVAAGEDLSEGENLVLQTGRISAENIHLTWEEGEIPRLYQWDERWGSYYYGDNTMTLAGCGPTCLSMVVMGLTGEDSWNPVAVADYSLAHDYKTESGTSWELMSVGSGDMGVSCTELPLDENRMVQELSKGHPIICSMGPGDFTTTGHFIVLTGYDGQGFIINDPNSEENSEKIWTYQQLKNQIKNLWAFSL